MRRRHDRPNSAHTHASSPCDTRTRAVLSAPFHNSDSATRFKPFCAAVMSSVSPWSSRSPSTFTSPEHHTSSCYRRLLLFNSQNAVSTPRCLNICAAINQIHTTDVNTTVTQCEAEV